MQSVLAAKKKNVEINVRAEKKNYSLPSISMASQRQTCPNAPCPRILKNFSRCRGKSQRSVFGCEFELLVDS